MPFSYIGLVGLSDKNRRQRLRVRTATKVSLFFSSLFLLSSPPPHAHCTAVDISYWNSAKVCLGKMGGRSTLAAIGDTFFFSAFSLRCYLWHCPVLAAIKGVFSKARVKHRTLGISDQLGGNMPSYKSAYHTLLWYPTTHVRGLENRENK